MSRRRLLLGLFLAVTSAFWLSLAPYRRMRVPLPEVRAVVLDPYEAPVLQLYGRYRDALLRRDTASLLALLDASRGGFLEYRTLLTLASQPELNPAERARYYRRALALYPDDPLAKADTRARWLGYAELAEEAGLTQEAIEAYTVALPLAKAVGGLKRLEPRPLVLANIFLQAKRYREALEALDGRKVPSIEAPAYRALGRNEEALDAFERWLLEQPESATARYGRARVLLALGRNEEAEAAFASLEGSEALYWRAVLAYREGEVDRAVRLFLESGEPESLWSATDLLEGSGRSEEAIDIYLELARTDSSYADDAAYRALVLAERRGDAASAARAEASLPEPSYLALKRGRALELPQTSELADVSPSVLALANALARVDDMEAAVGELLFALEKAKDEATTVAIAERLQMLGEFRQSGRAAEAWLEAGSRNRKTWELAYPRAFPETVGLEAVRYGVEPELIWAVMRQESRFYPKAVSRSNAKGLMQFIPATWSWVAELLKEPPGDPFHPEDNIRYGAFYLRYLLDYFGGDMELAVPSYNRGQGYIGRLFESAAVRGRKDELFRSIDAHETREYLQRVMLNYEVYKGLY